jgi:hypothetical protein
MEDSGGCWQMPDAVYVFEVDWDNDGDFEDSYEDCTADLFSVECRRGRDYASQLTGRCSPGKLNASLKNPDGKYSSYNSTSPLYGNILPGRKVRLRTTAPVAAILWTGYLEKLLPSGKVYGIPTVQMEATGPISRIVGKKVTAAASTSQMTGTIIGTILDDAGWPADERSIDEGQTAIDNWFVNGGNALNAVRDVEETELGLFSEGADGKLVFEDRHHRLKVPHTTSQQTYSDISGAEMQYNDIEQQDPISDIYNDISAVVTRYTTAENAEVLWTLDDSPVLAPGESVTFWAEYPNTNKDSSTGAYVASWETPVVGTDITQTGVDNSDISVSASKFSNNMKIVITNNNAVSTATLTLVQALGVKVTKNTPVGITSEDVTSQDNYGKRTYPLPAPWLQSVNVGRDYTNYIVGRYKNPVPVISLSYIANKSDAALTEMLIRNISDRITVIATGNTTELGINDDFFIESIHHRISNSGTLHVVTYELSDAYGDGGFWVLGTSELGTNTKLAY